ncbi:MAG TPA: hypothetical protein VGK02_06830 [Candidatus Aquicultor sp.]
MYKPGGGEILFNGENMVGLHTKLRSGVVASLIKLPHVRRAKRQHGALYRKSRVRAADRQHRYAGRRQRAARKRRGSEGLFGRSVKTWRQLR